MTTESTQAAATDTTQGGVQAVEAEGAKPEGEGKGTPEAVADAAAKDAPVKDAAKTEPEGEVKYEFKMPEGVEADEKTLADFTKVAKELKLSPENAQKLVDIRSAAVTAAKEQHAATVQGWADAVKADKELGGDKLQETLATAKKAIDLGPPELKELLNDSGLGNHPAVVKWAHAIGKALSEDSFKAGSTKPAEKTDTASVLYGSSSKT